MTAFKTCLLWAGVALLVTRTWLGSIPGFITARSTLTIEALTFLAFIIQWARLPTCGRLAIGLRPSPLFLLLPIAAILPFLPTLNAPFLFDDFVNIGNAATGHLIQPIGGDGFFRPLGVLYYWLTFHWAAWNPLAWHLTGITIHAANTLLVFLFLKRLTPGGGGRSWEPLSSPGMPRTWKQSAGPQRRLTCWPPSSAC